MYNMHDKLKLCHEYLECVEEDILEILEEEIEEVTSEGESALHKLLENRKRIKELCDEIKKETAGAGKNITM